MLDWNVGDLLICKKYGWYHKKLRCLRISESRSRYFWWILVSLMKIAKCLTKLLKHLKSWEITNDWGEEWNILIIIAVWIRIAPYRSHDKEAKYTKKGINLFPNNVNILCIRQGVPFQERYCSGSKIISILVKSQEMQICQKWYWKKPGDLYLKRIYWIKLKDILGCSKI